MGLVGRGYELLQLDKRPYTHRHVEYACLSKNDDTKVPKHKYGADINNDIDLCLSSVVRFDACGSVSHEGQPPLLLSRLCSHEACVWRGMGRTVK